MDIPASEHASHGAEWKFVPVLFPNPVESSGHHQIQQRGPGRPEHEPPPPAKRAEIRVQQRLFRYDDAHLLKVHNIGPHMLSKIKQRQFGDETNSHLHDWTLFYGVQIEKDDFEAHKIR
jgi:hypothetical protein